MTSLHREQAFSQLLPYWKFHLDTMLHLDGSITGGLELQGIALESISEEALEQLRYRIVLFLHSLPLHMELQFFYQVRPFSPVLTRFQRETEGEAPEAYRFIWRDSAAYLEAHSNIWHTKLYLFVTLPREDHIKETRSKRMVDALHGLFQHRVQERATAWSSERLGHMHHAMETLKTSLLTIGLQCRALTASDLGELLYQKLNPTRAQHIPYRHPGEQSSGMGRFLREDLTFSGLQRFPREFILDDQVHRVLSLKDLPQRQFLGVLQPLLELREFPFDLTTGIMSADAGAMLNVLKRARNINANMRAGKRTEESAEHEQEVLQGTIDRLVQGDDRAFKVAMQVHYWGRNEEELREAEIVLRHRVHQCCEAKEVREEFSYPSVFVGALPGGFRKIKEKRGLDVLTPQALALLPLYQSTSGSVRPVVMLKNRSDELVGVDPFNPKLSASNAIIFGPTGRGKSFLAQFLLLHYFRLNPKMMIVDIGGSYRRLTELLGGKYLSLSHDSKTALNPFLPLAGPPDPATLGEWSGIVERMIKDEGEPHLDRITQHLIRQAILMLYTRRSDPLNFIGLRACFKRMAHESTKQDRQVCDLLAKKLSLWIEGEGASLLVGEQTLSLDAPLITVDLGGIPPTGDLQAIVMQILAGHIRYHVAHTAGPKIVLFDEVWKHLGDPTAASILDELYRTARKRFASVLSISQELEDFLNPVIKTSLVKNSETRFILNTIEELELLKTVFKLNDHELDLIRSLSMRRGHYSEVFSMVGDEHQVLRLESTPWIYWMCTTHPPELEVERLLVTLRPELTSLERIQFLAKLFPRGVSSNDMEKAAAMVRKELA